MFFFIKPSTIHLDCFTHVPHAYDHFKIDRASRFTPEWWKKLPKEIVPNLSIDTPQDIAPVSTMKRCQAFLGMYKEGFIMPLWTDCVFLVEKTEGQNRYAFHAATNGTRIRSHETFQYEGFLDHKVFQHAKLESVWLVKSKSDTKWIVSQPTYGWKHLENLFLLPGIIDFKYQNSTNVNLLLKREEGKDTPIILEAGYPIWWMAPMSEKKVVLHHHLISPEDFIANSNKGAMNYKFTKSYSADKETGLCPFRVSTKDGYKIID